jgi:hypothetical protein
MNDRDLLDAWLNSLSHLITTPTAGTTCYAAPTPSAKQAVPREMDPVMRQTG